MAAQKHKTRDMRYMSELLNAKAASLILNQETLRHDLPIGHITTIDETETKNGMNFLREFPDDFEEGTEGNKSQE